MTTSVLILMHLKAIVYGADNMKTAGVCNLESLCRKEGATVLGLYSWHRLTAHIGSSKGISSPGIHDPHRCDSV